MTEGEGENRRTEEKHFSSGETYFDSHQYVMVTEKSLFLTSDHPTFVVCWMSDTSMGWWQSNPGTLNLKPVCHGNKKSLFLTSDHLTFVVC